MEKGKPKPGEKYKHFKGGEYEIICIALDRDNPEEKSVIYEMLYNKGKFPKGTIWKGSLEDFCGYKEIGGNKIKRFTKI